VRSTYERVEDAFPKTNPVGLINQILDSERTFLCLHMQAHPFLSSVSFSMSMKKGTYIGRMLDGTTAKATKLLSSFLQVLDTGLC
jgi:hypothetical protein